MRYLLRIVLFALALALIGLAVTPTASPAQAGSPCDPQRSVPYAWHLRPIAPSPGDSVTLVFGSCSECVQLVGYEWPTSGPLVLDARMPEMCPLTLVCTPDSLEVPLGALAAGHFTLRVEVRAVVVANDSTLCTITRLDSLSFTIGGPPPPPPPPPGDSLLPFVNRIVIGTPPCNLCAPVVCPNQPIHLALSGAFPNGCYSFDKLELLPSMIVGPRVEPPIVRLTMTWRACMVCTMNVKPWSADTLLPALPPGIYVLPLQLRFVTLGCDSSLAETTYFAHRSFSVRDTCFSPPGEPCVMADWVHSGAGCDDFIERGGSAKATMTITSGLPLAGLQGRIFLSPPGLLVGGLAPVGRAQGMRIAWERTLDGAKFLMFAESGAPIGGARDCLFPLMRCTEPVLDVTLLPDTDSVTLPPVTHVRVSDLLGADSLGRAVPPCPIATLEIIEARICAGGDCDINHDGLLDVRDLVTMVHCILDSGPCPDTSSASFDCNGDGRLNVDDVLCCARTILRGGQRDTLPGRPEPGVAVQVGEAAWGARGVDLPVRLARADRVGAARLVFSLPADRYDVASVDLGAQASRWLEVHEMVDGKLVLGLIGFGPETDGPTEVDLTLRLAVRSGQPAGGELALDEAQFAGPDGATLDVPANPTGATLPGAGKLALSAARPNPFAGETRFALNLDRGAAVDVAIYDLSGRRVVTLLHGALGAGPHEFAWSGSRADGSRAGAGVYFVQARVGAQKLARKVVFLSGR